MAQIYVRTGSSFGSTARPVRARVPKTRKNTKASSLRGPGTDRRSSVSGAAHGAGPAGVRDEREKITSPPAGEEEATRAVRVAAEGGGKPLPDDPIASGAVAAVPRLLVRKPSTGFRRGGGGETPPRRGGGSGETVKNAQKKRKTTLGDGHLGSPDDEGRSEVR